MYLIDAWFNMKNIGAPIYYPYNQILGLNGLQAYFNFCSFDSLMIILNFKRVSRIKPNTYLDFKAISKLTMVYYHRNMIRITIRLTIFYLFLFFMMKNLGYLRGNESPPQTKHS